MLVLHQPDQVLQDLQEQPPVFAILDVVNERRVDTINNFDSTVDFDIRQNALSNFDQSKFLKLKNKKLDDYIECRTNRVLIHETLVTSFQVEDLKIHLLNWM